LSDSAIWRSRARLNFAPLSTIGSHRRSQSSTNKFPSDVSPRPHRACADGRESPEDGPSRPQSDSPDTMPPTGGSCVQSTALRPRTPSRFARACLAEDDGAL
jgi:hypothetical protein